MGMSNGVWVSSAWMAIMKITKPTNCVMMYGLPMKSMPKIAPSLWAATMPCMFIVSAWMTTPTHGQHHRQLVGDQLAGGTQAADQRVLVGAGPAGHEHAEHRDARHGQHVEDADLEVGEARRRARTGTAT